MVQWCLTTNLAADRFLVQTPCFRSHPGAILQVLQLSASQDLVCMNMVCERVGQPCLCRVSVALQKLNRLTILDLSANGLPSLPEAVHPDVLPALQHLDISHNAIRRLPAHLQDFTQLQVRHTHAKLSLRTPQQHIACTPDDSRQQMADCAASLSHAVWHTDALQVLEDHNDARLLQSRVTFTSSEARPRLHMFSGTQNRRQRARP
jgi:Leucine rich repeat